jgi:hypothetical protein
MSSEEVNSCMRTHKLKNVITVQQNLVTNRNPISDRFLFLTYRFKKIEDCIYNQSYKSEIHIKNLHDTVIEQYTFSVLFCLSSFYLIFFLVVFCTHFVDTSFHSVFSKKKK